MLLLLYTFQFEKEKFSIRLKMKRGPKLRSKFVIIKRKEWNVMRYPSGITQPKRESTVKKQTIHYGRRGMRFEEMINQSNEYYLQHQLAVVHKKPTPIRLVKVDYPKRSAAKITEAYFTEASTTDYNGVYQGRYIDFEAKATKNKTNFPLKNFHEHQIQHMRACTKQGGICFVLLWFSEWKRCFLLDFEILDEFWQNQKNGRKSIPFSVIEEKGRECAIGGIPYVDYLAQINIKEA